MSRTICSASGTYVIAPAGTGLGDAGYQVILSPKESWVGTVTLKTNTAPPGAAPVYVSVAYQNATSGAEIAAGTALTAGGAVIVSPTAGDLVAVYVQTTGLLVIDVNPATRGVTNSELATAFATAGYQTAGQDTPVGMLSASVAAMLAAGGVSRGGGSVGTNIAIGPDALVLNTSGFNNLAVGYTPLSKNTTGWNNTALGYEALRDNVDGDGNTAVGVTAMLLNTSGYNNTAFGIDALYTNETGFNNTALGSNALGFGKDGNANTAVGWRACFLGGGGYANTAVGVEALNTGAAAAGYNVAIGWRAGFSTLLSANVYVGFSAGLNNSGNSSVVLGAYAMLGNASGSNNICVGYYAGAYETGSNAFYVDSRDRTNTAGDKANAIIYGIMAAAGAASQYLRFNAKVGIGKAASENPLSITGLPTSAAGLAAGDVWLNSNVLTIVP